ncbi:hypothetical protein [Ancylobacter sp. FA202]|uniref:hypothetical protein n=1 Tax=Ancylobacter sp. FA202 TaxID=1111106 RepID=UPI0018DEE978
MSSPSASPGGSTGSPCNPDNERQVVVALTDQGRALRGQAGCLGDALLEASGQSPAHLGAMNRDMRKLRDALYAQLSDWSAPS